MTKVACHSPSLDNTCITFIIRRLTAVSLTLSLTAPHTRCPHTLTAYRQFTGRSFVRSFVGSIDRFRCRLVGWLGWLSHPPTHSPQPVTAHSQPQSFVVSLTHSHRQKTTTVEAAPFCSLSICCVPLHFVFFQNNTLTHTSL